MGLFQKRYELDRQAISLYGFAFYSIWAFFSLHGTIVPTGPEPAEASVFFSFFSPTIIAVCLVFVGLFHQQALRLASNPWVIVGCALVATIGSLIMVSLPREDLARHIATLVSHILFDLIMIIWLKAFSDFELEIIIKKLPGILIIAGLGIALLYQIPTEGKYTLFVALPLVQTAALLYAQRVSTAAPLSTTGATRSTLAKVLVMTALFCIASSILLAMTRFHEVNGLISSSFYHFFLAEVGLALLLVAIASFMQSFWARKKFPHSFSLWPLVSIVGCIAVFAFALSSPSRYIVLSAMGSAGYNLLFIVAFLVTAPHYHCSVLQLFSYGRAVYSIASALANLFALSLLRSIGIQAESVELIVLVLACQVVVVIGFLVFIINREDDRQEKAQAVEEASEIDETPKPSAIATMAETYKLSERETEVLGQLVKGRSIKRTSEELFVSVGTVNTYLRRLYQKLQIHSRQELLDLYEKTIEQATQEIS